MTIGLASVVATAIILLASNTTIINAQQLTNQSAEVTQNGTTATTTLFEGAKDSFEVQVPQGWVIRDVNNTGFTLAAEVTEGYGILAQLCPEEEEGGQQQQALTNVSSSSSNSSASSCQQQPQDEIIHIIRYPNLSARLQLGLGLIENKTTTDNILSYHLQKLQEVGYRSIEIVNNTETTVNVTNAQTNQTIQTVPAKFVEMTYVTNFAPNEIREGYFISTATNATAPDPGITKGYSIFYEGNSTPTNITSVVQKTTTSGNLLPPLPAPVRQVFDSFELIAAEEAAQTGGGITTTIDDGDIGGITTTIDDCNNTTTIDDDEDIGGGITTTIDDNNNTTTIDDCNNTTTIDDDIGGGITTTIDDGDIGGITTTIDDDIGGGTEPTELLTAEIISNGTQGIAPATFEFEADVTGGTEPYTFHWDFNEDEDSIQSDDDETISHTFEEAGTYNVGLTVTDSSGQRASDSIEITVDEPAAADEVNVDDEEEEQPITIEQPLTVDITSSDTERGRVVAPATFEFEADVSGGTEPYTYRWNFDDDGSSGESDEEQDVVHTFEEAGTYNVGLTITDSKDQTASDSIETTIEEPPAPLQEEGEEGEETTSANQDNNGNGGDSTGPSIEENDNNRKD